MDKPNLELPQRVAVSRPIFDRRSTFFFVAAVVAFAVLAWLVGRGPRAAAVAPGGRASPLSADALEKLALQLEDKNLHEAAAEAWRDYLASAAPPVDKQARVHFRMARLFENAGQYEAAIAEYYRSELLAAPGAPAGEENPAVRVAKCFERMGRYGEMAREVEQRTSIAAKPGDLTGQQIVAEIGPEKITAADFDRMLREEIDAMTPRGADPEAARREAYQQLASPQNRGQTLQQIVTRLLMVREARKRGLDREESYKARLAKDAEGLLARELTDQVVEQRAAVTPEDVKRYYDANVARYSEPGGVVLAWIVCQTEDDAKKVAAELDGGAEFAKLAAERSLDAQTRSEGGRIPDLMPDEGQSVPGIGNDKALHDELAALPPGRHLSRPVKVGEAWAVYGVVEKRAKKTPPFEEVVDRVRAECSSARRTEVLGQYLSELFEKYQVRMNPQAVLTTQAAGGQPE